MAHTRAAPNTTTARRMPALPSWKQLWFQLHWFIGITAGTVLMVVGLTGAILSFKEELLDLFNPGVRTVQQRTDSPRLAPAAIAAAVEQGQPGRRIAAIVLFADAGKAARVSFAPPPGQRRGETVYVDPYSGALLPAVQGADFFNWVDSLHRHLLLPRETGGNITGTLAFLLLGMAITGIYLRWPRRPLDWRTWLTFPTALNGRAFLWNLHAVLGTWVLPMYVLFTLTGVYWSFDVIRAEVTALADAGRAARAASAPPAAGKGPLDLAQVWTTFERQAGPWGQVTLRIPERLRQGVQITWLGNDARHDRQRNRMTIDAHGGAVREDSRYADLKPGQQLLGSIYALHVGSFFGLPGRVVMMLASLALPLFGITGWMLYLDRRRVRRASVVARRALEAAMPAGADAHGAHGAPLLVAYASQSGQAERLALQTAGALRQAGMAADLHAVDQLEPARLQTYRRALFIASTFGEGEAPDGARRFARQLTEHAATGEPALAGLEYGMLALGDRHYAQFCGFAHALDADLRQLGAQPMGPVTEVDKQDAAALACWSQLLARIGGGDMAGTLAADAPQPFSLWRLDARTLLNPGSQGGPLYELSLRRADDAAEAHWLPGALADVLPRHPAARVTAWLDNAGLAGDAIVAHGGTSPTLAQALAGSALPAPGLRFASPQACADSLEALAPRRYSLASLPQDGALQLLVRQQGHAGGLGIASGWLTEYAAPGEAIALRVLANPGFAPAPDSAQAAIFIGNGSGLSGLRAHLRARVLAGERRNWLLYGERERAHDSICAAEIANWQTQGFLPQLDLAFSRDAAQPEYVQDRLRAQAALLRDWVAQGACLYVCGSLQGMAGGVDAALNDILGQAAMEELASAGRYRRDVY